MKIVIGMLIQLICMIVCHTIAKKRGANAKFWAIMGCLFGPFAILFSFFSKPRQAT